MTIRIKSEDTPSQTFEKDIYAIDVDGNETTTVIRRESFTIEQREQEKAHLDLQITSLNEQKAKLQADIDAALNL